MGHLWYWSRNVQKNASWQLRIKMPGLALILHLKSTDTSCDSKNKQFEIGKRLVHGYQYQSQH